MTIPPKSSLEPWATSAFVGSSTDEERNQANLLNPRTADEEAVVVNSRTTVEEVDTANADTPDEQMDAVSEAGSFSLQDDYIAL